MKSNSGLTLIELLIVVVLLAVLTSFAAPTFLDSGRPARVESMASDLAEVFKLARTEASRRSLPVFLSSSNGNQNEASWSAGWFLWVDVNRNGAFSNNEPRVQVKQNTHTRIRVVKPDGNYAPLQFGNSGFAGQFGTNASLSFFVCEPGYAMEVRLFRSGRVEVLSPAQQTVSPPSSCI